MKRPQGRFYYGRIELRRIIMEETMLDYIKESSTLVRNNTLNSKELTKKAVEKYLTKDFNRIIIIASGSSYNGSYCARLFMEKLLKVKVDIITSFTFNNYETIFDDKTFVFGVGQSGRSTNTNDALDKARSHGLTCVGLTGNVEAIMKDHVDTICNWGMGIEKIGFVTKGVATLTLFLDLFAIEAAYHKGLIDTDEYNRYHNELLYVSEVMDDTYHKALKWYEDNEEELTDLKRVQILGYGTSHGAALEGALKIAECTGHAATAYEMEEFLHGPSIETNGDRTVIIIDSGDTPSDRARLIYENLHVLTDRVYLLTTKTYEDQKVLTLKSIPEYFSTLVNCIPFQIIAAKGRDKWVNPLDDARKKMNDIVGYKAPKTGKELGL